MEYLLWLIQPHGDRAKPVRTFPQCVEQVPQKVRPRNESSVRLRWDLSSFLSNVHKKFACNFHVFHPSNVEAMMWPRRMSLTANPNTYLRQQPVYLFDQISPLKRTNVAAGGRHTEPASYLVPEWPAQSR